MWKLAGVLSGSALVLMTVPAILLTLAMTDSGVDTVSGTVRYLDGDVELPMGACVEVVLVDVSGDMVAIAKGRQGGRHREGATSPTRKSTARPRCRSSSAFPTTRTA